jgi:LDH2 family malate/lactate/ureidoglycolate dehydrogenase
MVIVSISEMERVGVAGYESAGASRDDAAFLFGISLDKAAQGDHTRGLKEVPHLIARARSGELDLQPSVAVLRQKSGTALVDGGPLAHPELVCRFGMKLAVEKARQHGVGWVGARAQAQVLRAHVHQAVREGMVGLAMVQGTPYVAPLGGYEPLLGDGPFALGVPAGTHDPVILDMSTTETSASPVLTAARHGQPIPAGLVLDDHGNPTTDPTEFPTSVDTPRVAKGSLVPLGGGHKGYGLIFAIGLLSMVLTDTSPPWDFIHARPGNEYGTVLVAVDPSAFDDSGRTEEKVDAFIERIAASPRVDGVEEILYPGQRSQRVLRERKARGWVEIPVSDFEAMQHLAEDLSVAPPQEYRSPE